MKKNNRKGFTIVELVIVIAVIAILAAVLIPTFTNVINDANASAALQEARNIYTNYVAEFDYSTGNAPARDLVIKVDGKYFAVKGGELKSTAHANLDKAEEVAGSDVEVICDVHVWSDGACSDCEVECKHTDKEGTKCKTCGKTGLAE